jgi:hypothetical protein
VGKKRKKFVRVTERIPSDDYVVKDGDGNEILDEEGNAYHPHAGEWIVLRRDVSGRIFDLSQDMTNAEYFETMLRILTRQVRDWSWTNDDDEPLPKPTDKQAFRDALVDLGGDERGYLMSKVYDLLAVPNESKSQS